MKQAISPKVFIAIIAVAVVLLVGGVWWVWKAPSVSAGATAGADTFHPHPGGAREQAAAMRAERMGRAQGQAAAPQNTAR